jgi:hypothetical protein
VLGDNIVLLKSLDEEEFFLVNAQKLKPYLIREEYDGEELTTQEGTRRGDCQVNLIAHPNRGPSSRVVTYFIGAILVSYFRPPSVSWLNKLLPNQELVSPYPSDEGLLLEAY